MAYNRRSRNVIFLLKNDALDNSKFLQVFFKCMLLWIAGKTAPPAFNIVKGIINNKSLTHPRYIFFPRENISRTSVVLPKAVWKILFGMRQLANQSWWHWEWRQDMLVQWAWHHTGHSPLPSHLLGWQSSLILYHNTDEYF